MSTPGVKSSPEEALVREQRKKAQIAVKGCRAPLTQQYTELAHNWAQANGFDLGEEAEEPPTGGSCTFTWFRV